MSDIIVLGTDTEVGKTTFCLMWMAAFRGQYEYWKPVETGISDTEQVTRLAGPTRVHPPLVRYSEPVAPGLAAHLEGSNVPRAAEIAAALPASHEPGNDLLIETFGSPLSPLSDHELQVRFLLLLESHSLLVCSSAVGAIGRTLQSLTSLHAWGVFPAAVILLGPRDPYAVEQIRLHGRDVGVFELEPPTNFQSEGIVRSADKQLQALQAIRDRIQTATEKSVVKHPFFLGEGGPVGSEDERARSAHRNPRRNAEGIPFADSEPPNIVTRTQGAESLVQRDRQSVWHPYTSLRDPDPPLVVVEAKDEFLTLGDGRTLIDGISSWWTIQHGHRHPVLMQALAEASTQFDHVLFAGVTHSHAVELAERMLATMPWPNGRVFYSDNGSTAVEVALKMAYQFWCHRDEPQRTLFVGFDGAYHGDTFGAMSVGRDPLFFGLFEPLLFRAENIPVSAARLDELLSQVGEKVAAVIIEPLVQGAGGMLMHSPEELRQIYEVTRQHRVLFIADEVMTGGGRTGTLWAHQAASIVPDLVCAGKTISGGVMPIAATLAAPPIVEAFDTEDQSRTFFHGHSFTAHPLGCAVGLANWRHLVGEVESAAARIEQCWKEYLPRLQRQPGVKDVRIRGTIAAIDLDVSGGYLATVSRQLRQSCLEMGVFLRPLGNVLYSLPPLCTSENSLEQIASAMGRAVKSIASGSTA